jgi:hypothetical protein
MKSKIALRMGMVTAVESRRSCRAMPRSRPKVVDVLNEIFRDVRILSSKRSHNDCAASGAGSRHASADRPFEKSELKCDISAAPGSNKKSC